MLWEGDRVRNGGPGGEMGAGWSKDLQLGEGTKDGEGEKQTA